MTLTKRDFLVSSAAVGTITILPFRANAAAHSPHTFKTDSGDITVRPISHASFILETPMGAIWCDPVGDPALYADMPDPALIAVTHRHGDHFNAEVLNSTGDVPIITNGDVHAMMDDALKGRTAVIGNGEGTDQGALRIDAIPAYNLAEDKQKFHPKARGDNGYILTMGDFRIYVSGDTEDIPEMRALEDIDLAFVCMNLPYTMTADAAASAVAEFKPKFVYPYHYRGKDNGTQDPAVFAKAVGDASKVRLADWYPDNDSI